MTTVFETMRGVVEGGVVEGGVARVPLLPWHLERLLRSIRRLEGEVPEPAAIERVLTGAQAHATGAHVVRLQCTLVDGVAVLSASTRALVRPPVPLRLTLVDDDPATADGPRDLKLGDRAAWDRAERAAASAGADEPLTLRPDGTLGETSRGNLFAWIDGVFVTPPDDGSILPGVARQRLLVTLRSRGIACCERPLHREELGAATLWSANAVHGPRPARLRGLALVDPAPGPAAPDPLAALW